MFLFLFVVSLFLIALCVFLYSVLCVIFSVCVFVFAFFIVMCFRGDVYLQRSVLFSRVSMFGVKIIWFLPGTVRSSVCLACVVVHRV